jgi:NADH-quinone oxidoreductase subunit M
LISLSSIAVPGFNGFVGEFLILVGSWKFSKGMVVAAALGVILAAAYILWMVQRVFYGDVTNPKNQNLADLSAREWVVLAPLVALALWMGVASPYFTRYIEPSVDRLVIQLEKRTRPALAAPVTATTSSGALTARSKRAAGPDAGEWSGQR